MPKVDWKHGNIKEVAQIFHTNGMTNITYETTSNSVVFFCDGFWVATYNYKK
jgi:hypothetical protein